MPKYEVEVQRTIYCQVTVEADSPDRAMEDAKGLNFPLPLQEEWQSLKGEYIIIRTSEGEETLLEEDT